MPRSAAGHIHARLLLACDSECWLESRLQHTQYYTYRYYKSTYIPVLEYIHAARSTSTTHTHTHSYTRSIQTLHPYIHVKRKAGRTRQPWVVSSPVSTTACTTIAHTHRGIIKNSTGIQWLVGGARGSFLPCVVVSEVTVWSEYPSSSVSRSQLRCCTHIRSKQTPSCLQQRPGRRASIPF